MSDQNAKEERAAVDEEEQKPSEATVEETLEEGPVEDPIEVVAAADDSGDAEEDLEVEDDEPVVDELQQARDEAAQYKERMLRVAADFENFKKRARRDLTEGVKNAENKVVLDYLPVVDNLERALSHGEASDGAAEASDDSLLSGVRMVHKQFLGMLARYQIEPFDAVGEIFDPELHEALQQMPSADFARNTVMAEVQRGYRRGERLVRPAMVVVSMGPPVEATDGDAGEEPEQQGEAG